MTGKGVDHDGKRRPRIHLSDEDVERAFRNAENCRKLIERGKDPVDVFKALLSITSVDDENAAD
ncbi:MAG: hypothetical protein ACTSU5_02480 [Promethearchaeota archaeon]